MLIHGLETKANMMFSFNTIQRMRTQMKKLGWRSVVEWFMTLPPQLSRVKFTNDVIDVQDEDYEIISGEQETNGRVNGVGQSDKAVSSTLSSKAGIILVSLS